MSQVASQVVVEASEVIRRGLARVRIRHLAVMWGQGLGLAVGAIVLLLAAEMLVDWLVELPWGVRAALLGLGVLAVGGIVLRYVAGPILRGPDDDELALMVERTDPRLSTRLIASVQLTRPGALPAGSSLSLVGAMVRETEEMAQAIDWDRVVRMDRLARTLAMGGAILMLGLALYAWGGQTSRDLLQRAFLSNTPVPRKTRVVCQSQNLVVAIGDSVTLSALAEGIAPPHGLVRIQYDSGRSQSFAMDRQEQPGNRYVRRIESVQDSFTYAVYLNDGRSEPYRVEALPRPAVAAVECVQVFPRYTKLEPVRRAVGDLALLDGSKLQVRATASKPIARAWARVVGRPQDLPLEVGGADRRELTGVIDVRKGVGGFSIRLVDQHRIESRDEAVYRIEVLADKPPTVRITWPDRREELVTQMARLLVAFEAADDYAIGKVRLHYKIEGVDGGREQRQELDLGGQTPKTLRRRYEWPLGRLASAVSPGASIEYWIEVEDTNDVTGPGVAQSDHYMARVVSEVEKRQDLMNRLNDYLGTITDVAQDQERLNQALGQIILEKK